MYSMKPNFWKLIEEKSKKNFYLQRVHLDIQVGEHAIDYANVAQREKLSELQLRIRQLLDQVGQITKEQNYQRVKKQSLFLQKLYIYNMKET